MLLEVLYLSDSKLQSLLAPNCVVRWRFKRKIIRNAHPGALSLWLMIESLNSLDSKTTDLVIVQYISQNRLYIFISICIHGKSLRVYETLSDLEKLRKPELPNSYILRILDLREYL